MNTQMGPFGYVHTGQRTVENVQASIIFSAQSSSCVKTMNVKINGMAVPQFDVFGTVGK